MKNKKEVYSWVLYDWANSAFATTILAVVLPIFYKDVAAKNLADNLATSYWAYTQTVGMVIIAFLSPILGAISDFSNSKKKFLKFFAYLGIIGTALLFFIDEGDYILASLFFILGSIGFSGGNVFYDSLLPKISTKNKMDYISSLGFAFGYLGGGVLLAINLLMISKASLFALGNSLNATKFSFLTVSLWWFIFSLPIFKNLKEESVKKNKLTIKEYIKIGFSRVRKTFKQISKYRELFKFLIAFWIYNDGIGTIIRMATIYGREIGISQDSLIIALLSTQIIGFPCALIFGKLGERIGAKKGILIALMIYLIITIKGYFISTSFDFWLLAVMVGIVQGGAQALSRSLYGIMVPKDKAAEFYGFFGVSSKFAAITGPLVFGLISQLTGSSRLGIVSIAVFFILGMIILAKVDVDRGANKANK